MGKRLGLLLSGVISLAIAGEAMGQDPVGTPDIVQFRAESPAPAPASQPQLQVQPNAPAPAPPVATVRLRSLSAVRDALARETEWHDAAKLAESHVSNPALRSKIEEQLNALSVDVAGALIKHPTGCAVVSLATYADSTTDTQHCASVSFEGLSRSLNAGFYPRLLAGIPATGSGNTPANPNLVLDRAASGYLIYSLSDGELKAALVPFGQMQASYGDALAAAAPATPGGSMAQGVAPLQNTALPPADASAPDATASPVAPDGIPTRQPPRAAIETDAQQEHASAVQDRAVTQDDGVADESDTVGWGADQAVPYSPHWINIDIVESSGVSAPAAAAAPAARTGIATEKVGAAAPKRK